MAQLWLVPVDDSSFQTTLAEPIELSDQPQKPPEFPDRARVWGVRTDQAQGDWERNQRNLERMQTGDPLLIYRNGQGEYRAKGRVGEFWHTESIRDEFWNGGPALDVYSVEDYEEIDVSPKTVNRILNYKPNFRPQGLRRVADEKLADQLVRQLYL